MTIRHHEIMEPEELIELGAVFEETWVAVRHFAGDAEEHRAALATIILRLGHLRDRDQMKAAAIRIFRSEPSGLSPDRSTPPPFAGDSAVA